MTGDMVEIRDLSRDYALTRSLEGGRLKFTREEFEENLASPPSFHTTSI
jgi:hypothetical protein